MDHGGHDHSAHAGATMSGMDHMGTGVLRHEDGTYYYTHGAYLGHVVPGTFFMIWGTWWAVATFWRYLSCAALRRGFQSRPWHTVPWGPRAVQTLPLEPIIKMVLPAFGILGELWLGHEQYMALYVSDGKFNVGNINDWQHSMMYFAFIASGAIDLLGHYAGLPDALEKAFLSLAFLVEGTLLVFHLKGPAIEFRVHLLLCLQIFATVVAIAAEGVMPTSFVAASARPMLTIAQGAWWIQTAYIMYRGIPAWDPEYMGSDMMAPVVFTFHIIIISLLLVALFLVLRVVKERTSGARIALPVQGGGAATNGASAYHAVGDAGLELSALTMSDKERFG